MKLVFKKKFLFIKLKTDSTLKGSKFYGLKNSVDFLKLTRINGCASLFLLILIAFDLKGFI